MGGAFTDGTERIRWALLARAPDRVDWDAVAPTLALLVRSDVAELRSKEHRTETLPSPAGRSRPGDVPVLGFVRWVRALGPSRM
ncbi:MAG: hypothetical protein ABMB14_23430, partial [Myxococcota bacterium]